MTTAEVSCGSCGFKALIRAQRDADGRVSVELESECPMLRQFASRLQPIDPEVDGETFFRSSVYQAADACLRHIDCLAPVAVVRAVQVEAGMALPHAVELRIVKE
jgi:hypothetical protein